MIDIRPSTERGITRLDWLDSRHSFSFGGYYDPEHMGVSALRVINDDRVAPGTGFAPHSHRDMEILSYVKRGTIEHKDSMGNEHALEAGAFQLMSAGTGITHSEYNPSVRDPLEFLQIWIIPDVRGVAPAYQQRRFDPAPGLKLIATPEDRDDTLRVHQDVRLLLLRGPVASIDYELEIGREAYLHVVAGQACADGRDLCAGDGARVRGAELLTLGARDATQVLLFDLPANGHQ